MKYAFGLDLGGTTCKMGLFEADGTLIEKWEIPTDTSEAGSHILGNIAEAVRNKMLEKNINKNDVVGVGLGVPGPVSSAGVVNKCANLGWGVVPAADELSAMLSMKVKVGNDANVAALGEAFKGAGQKYSSIVMVTLGTGVGGGVVINQQIISGAHGAGGEIGHITVNENETEKCGCGRRGCVEYYASATGIARLARQTLVASNAPSSLRDMDINAITAKDVLDAVKAGDAIAKESFEKSCDYLTKALCHIAEVVDPEAFVIGGGVSKAGDILVTGLKSKFSSSVFHACANTDIVIATLGNDAGMYGAVRMVL